MKFSLRLWEGNAMRLNKGALRGTKKVFSFTLRQFIKNKANIVTAVILLLLSILSVPVMTLASGGEAGAGGVSAIDTIYLSNETELNLPVEELGEREPYFAGTKFVTADFSAGEYKEKIENSQLYIRILKDEETGGFHTEIYRLDDLTLGEEALAKVQALVASAVRTAQLEEFQIGSEQAAAVTSSFQVKTGGVKEYMEKDGVSWDVQYMIQLVYALVVIVVSVFSVTYIIRTVVEEKASKLVELLMVSVKPLALIVGKILAAMTYVFGMFLILVAGFGISYCVSGMFMDVSAISGMMSGMGISGGTLKIGPETLGIILISLLLGYFTFAIIAGLSGTGCSTMDDIQSASTLVTLLIMAGYLVSIFISSAGSASGGVALFASLCPVLSVFCAPVQYIVGNISFWVLFLSWVIQAAVIVLLALFCARIYSSLLMHKGGRVKLGQMISMAMEGR